MDHEVPWALRVGAAYSWRLLVTAAAVVVLALAVAKLALVALPVFLALFATALLRPPSEWLRRHGLPPAAAAATAVAGGLALLAGILVAVVPPFIAQLEELGRSLREGIERGGEWLIEGPLDLSERQLDDYVQEATDQLRANSDAIIGGVLSGVQLAGEVLVVFLLVLVITFFFLKDGDRIWAWVVSLFAPERREDARELGTRSWDALAGYLRGMTVVALFDSIFIGLALVVVGVPAALPLAVFTFFGAYIPIAGAVVTGLGAVVVALVTNGLGPALIVLAAVIVVQQTESNLLHPVVVGRAVAVHPVAILLAVTAGAILAGVLGAFVAVPLTAVASRVFGYVRERREQPSLPDALAPAP